MVQKFMNHTALRIADPARSLKFYETNFGMKQLTKLAQPGINQYILGLTGPHSLYKETPWYARGGLLQLVHYDKDTKLSFQVNNGNKEPYRGFGHICFSVVDLEKTCETLEKNGVKFQKRLADGRQKNIAFALDPDGYWIELISNGESKPDSSIVESTHRLNHSMIRVKNKEHSLEFYKKLGTTVVDTLDFPEAKFTLYFLSFDPEQVERDGRSQAEGLIELTYNHGSENDPNVKYHTGTTDPQGFLHFGVGVEDPKSFAQHLESEGIKVTAGEVLTVYDPDGYIVKILPQQSYG